MATDDNVHISLSITKNLGNYNSLKIECGYGKGFGEDEDVDNVFQEVFSKVEEQLEKRLAEAEEALAD